MEGTEKSSLKAIDSAIFNYFKDLTSTADNARLNSGFKLIEHLKKVQDDEKRKKELHYVLRRLVRGVGASTSASRAGFFSTLVTILKVITPDELNNDELFSFVEKELHVGKTVATKNDADAVVGRILSCAALIRSERIASCCDKEISRIAQILVRCSKHRSYHNSLALSLLCELVQKTNEEQFVEHIWPVVREELAKPWEKQTVNTVHCLLVIAEKFPSILSKKFMSTHFGGSQLLNNSSYKHFLRIFWDPNSKELVAHPAFEYFAKYLASSKSLEAFWITEVDTLISSRTKLREVVTLKVLTDILLNAETDKVKASILLTPNVLQMIVASLKTMKFKKDEVLQAFYDEFLEALTSFAVKSEDDEKVNVIQKLILRPGTLDIEKYSSHRIIHQIIATLGEEGIQKVYGIYKNIFLDRIPKNSKNSEETWLNVERQNAGYILQTLIAHKSVQTSFEWRTEELKFMLMYSLFFVNDQEEICSEKEDAGVLTNDLAAQLKNIFFASLQLKLPRLYDAKMILLTLVNVSNAILKRKNYSKCLRIQLDEKIVKVWKEMYAEVSKEDKDNKLQLVFHILLLHMGLQLFREPEMAQAAISDLEKCLEKAKKKVAKASKQKEGDLEAEPEWIEVVVDLFLHLLSQNNSALRTIVNSVFPHLCSSLTYTGMHQILSVLDMKVGNDLLSADDADENNDIEEDDGPDDNIETSSIGSEDSDDSGEEEEEDDEEIIEEEEEESTATDQLRNAVSVALGSFVRDNDQDSVDLDDLDEEEGNKLDEALAAAFKAIKRPEQGKKSKSFRVKTTTTMHFRTRVLDLIEIYLQHSPDLVMVLEIMLALYNMIEFCGDAELKPLANKVEKVLMKLTGMRSFTSTKDITEQNICDFIRTVVEKKVKASAFEILNKIRAKCCVFLIACSKTLEGAGQTNGSLIVDTFKEYIVDFMKLRNPAINATLLGDIFKMRWRGILALATTLAENGLSDNTRQFRRIQIIELLDVVYKNYTLIKEYEEDAAKLFKIIETALQNHISCLAQKNQHSIREFTTILNVLHSAQRCHSKIPLENNFDKEKLCNEIQSIRKRVKLENQQSYNRFCSVFGLRPIKNFEVIKDEQKITNGNHEIESTDDEENLADPTGRINNANKPTQNSVKPQITRKRKGGQDFKKQKKLRKEQRMKKSSEGLNGGISFKSAPMDVNVSQIEIADTSDSST